MTDEALPPDVRRFLATLRGVPRDAWLTIAAPLPHVALPGDGVAAAWTDPAEAPHVADV